MRFCSIVHPARLPHARVLAHALAKQHPESAFTVLVTGSVPSAGQREPFEVLSASDLAVPGWEMLLQEERWGDLVEFFKPHILRRLMAEGAEAAVHLDSAVDLLAPLDSVGRALEKHSAVLAPRLLTSFPVDGRRPDSRDLRQAGRLGASLIALAHQSVAFELVEWWAERLTRTLQTAAVPLQTEPNRARRALSAWIDLAPSVFRDIAVLTDPGSAVSHWNLHERSLCRDGGLLTVDGRPLRFVHFEGFDPSAPFLLNSQFDRIRVSDDPVLGDLCESYAQRLQQAGWRDYRRLTDVGLELPGGMTFDNRLSYLLAEATASGHDFGDVFTVEGADAFMHWLASPAPHGAAFGINRYMYGVFRERDDLRVAYPDLDSMDGRGFAGWAWVFGRDEMAIPERFMPPRPKGFDARRREPASRGKRVPLPRGKPPDLSMDVTGLLTGTLGLGEAARGYVRALETAKIPVSTSTVDVRQFVDLSATPHEGYARVEYTDLDGAASAGFKLICINADELPRFAESVDDRFFTEQPTIGVWAWETNHVPDRWRDAFGLLDEIWTYSDYVAENLGRVAPIPVRRIPPPVSPPEPGDVELDLGIPRGFRFLFMFDFFSTIRRKNPVGLITAFKQAFEPGEGPQLVIKTINGVHRPQALEEVRWAARGRPDVHVIDRSLSARERDALVASCDCYASLHRAEGFGLPLAECMALGKPVIGTAFSGTTDFMTRDNSYLVSYSMTRVGADCEIYPPQGTWAEPDVLQASELMREVVEDSEDAGVKGQLAQRDVERLYSPAAVGAQILSRLEEIAALWPEWRRAFAAR